MCVFCLWTWRWVCKSSWWTVEMAQSTTKVLNYITSRKYLYTLTGIHFWMASSCLFIHKLFTTYPHSVEKKKLERLKARTTSDSSAPLDYQVPQASTQAGSCQMFSCVCNPMPAKAFMCGLTACKKMSKFSTVCTQLIKGTSLTWVSGDHHSTCTVKQAWMNHLRLSIEACHGFLPLCLTVHLV